MSAVSLEGLRCEGLCVRRGDAQVVNHVDLSAHAGQWLAVVGPNGAGKSSLLQALAGLWPAASGEVWLMGTALSHWPATERARRLAWLGQSLPDDADLTVADLVALGRLPHQGWLGWPRQSTSDLSAIEQALADADLLALRDRRMPALSGGERQRAHLARALATQAPVLLLDEPAAHLDAPHQRVLAGILRAQAGLGRAVVSVVHELPLALAADRIAVMQSGSMLVCGDARDPTVHRAIESVFDDAIRIVQVEGRWTPVPTY